MRQSAKGNAMTHEFIIQVCDAHNVEELTDLHLRSFKPDDHVPVRLGRRYVKATYQWLVSSRYSYVLGAFASGKLVGLVSVCDRSYTWLMFKACWPEFMLSIAGNPGLLLNKKMWERLFRKPDITTKRARFILEFPGVAQITIGAVDDGWRGKGVFPALVGAIVEQSEKKGSRAIRVGIYKNNRSSRQVFIKGGWKEIKELETMETVFYMKIFDGAIAAQLGIDQ